MERKRWREGGIHIWISNGWIRIEDHWWRWNKEEVLKDGRGRVREMTQRED